MIFFFLNESVRTIFFTIHGIRISIMIYSHMRTKSERRLPSRILCILA